MKGAGWIVLLLGLLGVAYLLTRDVQTLKGDRGGKAVVEPLQQAKEAGDALQQARNRMTESIDKAEK